MMYITELYLSLQKGWEITFSYAFPSTGSLHTAKSYQLIEPLYKFKFGHQDNNDLPIVY